MLNKPTSYIQKNRTYLRTLLTDGVQLSKHRLLSAPPIKERTAATTALIIPGVPNSALGSIGDAALLISTLTQLTSHYSLPNIYLLGLADDEISIPDLGTVKIVGAFDRTHGTHRFAELCQHAAELYVIGADILDGKYDPGYTCRVLTYANHAARLKMGVTILGFSFNKAPNPSACRALKNLRKEVNINLRDDASHERFRTHVGRDANLTADIAFLLKPVTPPPSTTAWIGSRKARDELIVGININRHALSNLPLGQACTGPIEAIAQNLPQTAHCGRRINYILIPHDLKASSGDIELLSALQTSLQRRSPDHVIYVELTDPRAIKGLAGQLDALVTGRMHLAIAALGVSTPVLCIDYQDKFEGLLRKFGLNLTDSLCSKERLTESINERVLNLLNRRITIRAAIQENLPTVQALAQLNFKNLELIERH